MLPTYPFLHLNTVKAFLSFKEAVTREKNNRTVNEQANETIFSS